MSAVLEDLTGIRAELCRSLCADVNVIPRDDGSLLIDTPFYFPDGDGFTMYLQRLGNGGFKITDKGATMMRLSYEQDVEKLREGTRSRILDQILGEMGVQDDRGEFSLEAPANRLGDSIFRFGQALTRIHDLSFLNRVQVESTFYDDLQTTLADVIGAQRLIRDYAAPGVPKSDQYRADFGVEAARPLLIFGVPSGTKARLATVVIQYLRQQQFAFHSLVVYQDMAALPRADVARLTDAANDQVANVDAETIRRKVSDSLALAA
jgi:hypothetical protein